jgi:DNA helicase IV
MKVLRRHRPTPEQTGIINRIRSGVTIIRGAAGSGKTSTALFSLRASAAATINQLTATGDLPARVLVLTYNNSLRGYVASVAHEELAEYGDKLELTVETFDKWARNWTMILQVQQGRLDGHLTALAIPFPRDTSFVIDEVSYVLGRFLPGDLAQYVGVARTGRGASPQMPAAIRERLLAEVIEPYLAYKSTHGLSDFNDRATGMISATAPAYDVVVVDEAQDLSANQIRAIMAHCAEDGIVTFVTDTTQRIYPRGTTWAECGIVNPRTASLHNNYRNTKQISALAAALAAGLPVDADGTRPDPATCTTNGPLPKIIKGRFSEQTAYAIAALANIDLESESVGFLHLKGGQWLDYLRSELTKAGYGFCELQGVPDWPEGGSNIGLSTLHSAKGLEFDHVFILGITKDHAAHGDEDEDEQLIKAKKLLAMAVGRARLTVALGIKPGDEVDFIEAVDHALYEVV